MIPDLSAGLHWARPEWLWALLVLPVVAAWSLWRGRQPRGWERDVDAHLLPHLLVPAGRGGRGRRWILALLLGLALAVLALAGPGWQQQAQPVFTQQSPLVVVLDLSSRTGTRDLPPSRLLQARAKLASLLRQRVGGQVGLVVYAQDAYTVAPLTGDAGNVALYLDALSPEVMPADGQRTDRALDWATQLLQRSGARSGRIVLLTDRADGAASHAAAQARAQGMRVSVLGLGTPAGAAYRDRSGQIGSAALDEPGLQQLAREGGGRYQRLSADDSDLRALDLLRADAGTARQERGTTRQWLDQGYWLLPPLMLLALLAFRRRGGALAAVLLLGMAPLLPPPALAAPAAPVEAAPAAGASLWQRADQRQAARLEQGVQAYRAGDFATAKARFEGIDSSAGWYNLGNARARLGDLDGAIAAYDRALQRQPGMADAVANRAVVDAARRRPPQGGGQQGNGGKNGKNDKTDKNDRQNGGSAAQGGDRAGSPRAGQQAPDRAPPPRQETDAQAQQRADAEQRQRMQQALQQSRAGAAQDRPQQAVRSDGRTPQQREQQQAVEAWMRRVPDEPGALLRAKFELENERRKREQR